MLTKQWQPLLTSGSTGSRHLATRTIYYVCCVNLYSDAKWHFKMPSVLYHIFLTEAPLYVQKPSTACTAIPEMVLDKTIFQKHILSMTRSRELNSNNSREARVNADGRIHFLKGFCLLLWAISLRPPTKSALSNCGSLLFSIWNPQSTENQINYPTSFFFPNIFCTHIHILNLVCSCKLL